MTRHVNSSPDIPEPVSLFSNAESQPREHADGDAFGSVGEAREQSHLRMRELAPDRFKDFWR
jgi:hypothetical protein